MNRDPRSDEELARDSRNGDPKAMEILLSRWEKRISAYCRRRSGNPDDAGDDAQAVRVAFEVRNRWYKYPTPFDACAWKIMKQAVGDEARKRSERRSNLPEQSLDAEPDGPDCVLTPNAISPADPTGARMREAEPERQAIRTSIQRKILQDVRVVLRAEWAQVIHMYYWLGMSTREIAIRLDVPQRTVESWLQRARQKLAKHWEKRGWVPGFD